MGTTYFVYPGAEHSRFGHSIGTMWLTYQFGNKFRNSEIEIDDDLISKMLLAALIHDIGHGPFSHIFERITTYNHKDITLQFVERKLPEMIDNFSVDEIKRLLKKDLSPEDAWVGDLLDSQIDVDRMDFLLRDSLYTGVDYGRFDIQRVFHSLAVGEVEGENHLVMLLKGLHAFEGFFIAHHHMYWQVYFHRVTRVYEVVLEKIFRRMRELLLEKEIDVDIPLELRNLLTEEKFDLEEFFLLDDCTILETIKRCYFSEDGVLKDLSTMFFERKIFRCIKKEKIRNIVEFIEKSKKAYERRKISFEYYFAIDEPEKTSVKRPVLEKGLLMASKDKFGRVSGPFDFIDNSDIIRSLYNVKHTELRMYCPRSMEGEMKEILNNI